MLDARGILDHIDGTGREPIDPIPNEVRAHIAAAAETQTGTTESSETPSQAVQLTTMQIKLDMDWRKDLKEWKSGEAVAKQQIASSIPDSLFMKIQSQGSAHEIWKALENHFQKRSQMVAIDLRRRIQDQRCVEKGDVVAHFATLHMMREDLAAMGQPLADNDFYAIIMGSLPASYDPYISAVNATSSVLGTTLSADDLMLTLTEEI